MYLLFMTTPLPFVLRRQLLWGCRRRRRCGYRFLVVGRDHVWVSLVTRGVRSIARRALHFRIFRARIDAVLCCICRQRGPPIALIVRSFRSGEWRIVAGLFLAFLAIRKESHLQLVNFPECWIRRHRSLAI